MYIYTHIYIYTERNTYIYIYLRGQQHGEHGTTLSLTDSPDATGAVDVVCVGAHDAQVENVSHLGTRNQVNTQGTDTMCVSSSLSLVCL